MRTTAHPATQRGLPPRRPRPPRASSSAEELVEAPVAVGLVVLLLEGALVELLEAERADEVLRVELPEHGGDAATCNGLVASCAQRASLGVVMGLAVRHALVVEEGASVEGLAAVPADEALRVPLCVEGGDVVVHDGRVAAATLGREHVEVVVAAVRLPVLLVEAVVAERVPALGAEEVLRVPGRVQRRHAFVEDGAVAVGAARGEQVVVVDLAVRAAVALEEVLGAQLLVAVGAREVLGVPGLA